MTIKWTDSATVKLVVLYGRHECLRNPFHPDFNRQIACFKAYKQIVQCMNIPGLTICDCVKRISFVKKQYCFELSKISSAISRGSFYKPKTSWFEMMHELFFPYIQSEFEYNEDSKKDCDCLQDEEGDGDGSGNENPDQIDECECPPFNDPEAEPYPQSEIDAESELYENMGICFEIPEKKYHRSKSRARRNRDLSKLPTSFTHGNHIERDSTVDFKRPKTLARSTNNKPGRLSSQVNHGINTRKMTYSDKGNDTSSPYVSQAAAQTERRSVTTTQTNFECPAKNQSPMRDDLSNQKIIPDSVQDKEKDRNNENQDEFDMFGKSVACQLRSLSLESAINLEKRIQDMMTEERLSSMKSSAVVESGSKECTCACNDCNECCNIEKEELCACGLPINKCSPVFPLKTGQCYGFSCN